MGRGLEEGQFQSLSQRNQAFRWNTQEHQNSKWMIEVFLSIPQVNFFFESSYGRYGWLEEWMLLRDQLNDWWLDPFGLFIHLLLHSSFDQLIDLIINILSYIFLCHLSHLFFTIFSLELKFHRTGWHLLLWRLRTSPFQRVCCFIMQA